MSDSPANEQTDAHLMSQIAAGDTAALAVLVRRHQSVVLSNAYRLLGRWDQAEDVAQDAFVRVFRAASSYKPTAAFTTWLYRIVIHLCLDIQRKKRRPSELPSELANGRAPSPGQSLAQQETADIVRRAVAALPDRQKTAVILHRYTGLSHQEIAEVTGWSVSSVESCLVRAYAQLRRSLSHVKPS